MVCARSSSRCGARRMSKGCHHLVFVACCGFDGRRGDRIQLTFARRQATLGGVQLFWPSSLIAVFPGRDEYRVVSSGNSERVFGARPNPYIGLIGLAPKVGGWVNLQSPKILEVGGTQPKSCSRDRRGDPQGGGGRTHRPAAHTVSFEAVSVGVGVYRGPGFASRPFTLIWDASNLSQVPSLIMTPHVH